jgi:hypothetical protein
MRISKKNEVKLFFQLFLIMNWSFIFQIPLLAKLWAKQIATTSSTAKLASVSIISWTFCKSNAFKKKGKQFALLEMGN